MHKISFTSVVAVDAEHLAELKAVWPTWQRWRPELLENMLLLVDGEEPQRFFGPKNGQDVIFVENELPNQRDKMLWSLLVQAPASINTPFWVKIDCDTLATGPGTPLTEYLDVESLAAPGWGYTKPVDALERLNKWYEAATGEPGLTGIKYRPDGHARERERAYYPRIIGWLTVIETAFSRRVAEFLTQYPPPFISHDTLLWYLAERWGTPAKRLSLKGQGWDHVLGLKNIQKRVAEVLANGPPAVQLPKPPAVAKEPPEERAPPHTRVLVHVLKEHFGNIEFVWRGAEIGVYRGQTSEWLLRTFPNLILWMIDPWESVPDAGGDRHSGQTQEKHEECRQETYRRTDKWRSRRLIAEQRSLKTSFLTSRNLHFVFIDGLHTYEAVRDDLGAWWPNIQPGGILVGHDIHHRRYPGLTQAVNEFAEREGLKVNLHKRKIWSIVKP